MIVTLPSWINCCWRSSETGEDIQPRRRYWQIFPDSENMTDLEIVDLTFRIMAILGVYTLIVFENPTNHPLIWNFWFIFTSINVGGAYFGAESLDRLSSELFSEMRRNFPEESLPV
jgi:hypothetical protein